MIGCCTGFNFNPAPFAKKADDHPVAVEFIDLETGKSIWEAVPPPPCVVPWPDDRVYTYRVHYKLNLPHF
jgi:hypothetical protein